MANPWFYVTDIPPVGSTVKLEEDEARHALRSRRLSPGEDVCLFDGLGHVADAAVVETDDRGCTLTTRVESIHQASPERPAIHIVAALPKGDRQSTMLSMITQLGAASFTPLLTERGVAAPRPGFAARAERIVLASCKQARRAHLPTIHAPVAVGEFVTRLAGTTATVLLADPGGAELVSVLDAAANPAVAWLLIGPEGGFTTGERAAAVDGGAIPVSLGSNIMRVETAAVAFTATVLALARIPARQSS